MNAKKIFKDYLQNQIYNLKNELIELDIIESSSSSIFKYHKQYLNFKIQRRILDVQIQQFQILMDLITDKRKVRFEFYGVPE